MNWLDAIFFVVITITTVNGLRKGFIQSFFSLINLALSFIVTIKTYKLFAQLMVDTFHMPSILAAILGFIVIWFICATFLTIISREIHNLTSKSFLAPLNIVGGAIFGFLKGYTITLIITILLSHSFLSGNILRLPLRESMIVNFSEPIIKMAEPYLKRVNTSDPTINIRKYISKNENMKLIEESMDQIENTQKTYKRITKELDF